MRKIKKRIPRRGPPLSDVVAVRRAMRAQLKLGRGIRDIRFTV